MNTPSSLDVDKPRAAARKVFERMWVAGTLGAFFAALARNLPVDLAQINLRHPVDWDRLVRYSYLLWLLTYFFISNVRNEDRDPKRKDLFFDFLQSSASLGAAYFVGFVARGEGFGPDQFASAVIAANFAIAIICGLSLVIFRKDADNPQGLNALRITGCLISVISILLIAYVVPGIVSQYRGLALIPLAPLSCILYCFWRLSLQMTVDLEAAKTKPVDAKQENPVVEPGSLEHTVQPTTRTPDPGTPATGTAAVKVEEAKSDQSGPPQHPPAAP